MPRASSAPLMSIAGSAGTKRMMSKDLEVPQGNPIQTIIYYKKPPRKPYSNYFIRLFTGSKADVASVTFSELLLSGFVRQSWGQELKDMRPRVKSVLTSDFLGDEMNPKRVHGSYTLNRNYSSNGYMTPILGFIWPPRFGCWR